MDAARKRRLQAQGWHFGTVQELLNLTDEDVAYIELKLKLAKGVRERRRRKGMRQVALAKMAGSSQSRVAKMEAADDSVSLDRLIRALLALGTSHRELARMIAASPQH